jgi:hypothetical protein
MYVFWAEREELSALSHGAPAAVLNWRDYSAICVGIPGADLNCDKQLAACTALTIVFQRDLGLHAVDL